MDETTLNMIRLAGKGYSCAQILLLLALQAREETNPALVRAMSGLAYGCGAGQATCGALTGGCCLIGLYAGKGGDEEAGSERLALMLEELSAWFADRVGQAHGGITCATIVGEDGPAGARQRCGAIVAETFAKAMEILVAGGIDP